MTVCSGCCILFFFNDTATPEISPLSLHDALPISPARQRRRRRGDRHRRRGALRSRRDRSEEHTSELQSRSDLGCRLLLEKNNIDKVILTAAAPFFPPRLLYTLKPGG